MSLEQAHEANANKKYGQEAKILAKETDALRDEFKELLGVLEHNLAEVLKQIDEQQHALEEAEKEYQCRSDSVFYRWLQAC